MLKKLLNSFALALHNIRTRLFHTLLSILGIVIGVGALVTVLSLIDGMEQYARDQITNTTSLKAVLIQTVTYKKVNDVSLQKENYNFLDYERFKALSGAMKLPATGYIERMQNGEVLLADSSRVGATVQGINKLHHTQGTLQAGRMFTTEELDAAAPVAFVNHAFAKQATGKEPAKAILGQVLSFKDKAVKVIGVLKPEEQEKPSLYLPITLFTQEDLKADPPRVAFEVDDVEQVQAFKAQTENWLKTNFTGDSTDFRVITNEGRVEQAAKGFLLFRVIMGLIVGISVIVGMVHS